MIWPNHERSMPTITSRSIRRPMLRIPSVKARYASQTSLARSRNWVPAVVRRVPELERSSRIRPIADSSRPIIKLTAGCEIFHRLPVSVKLPV